MSIERVDALCRCDECQKLFGVSLDMGTDPKNYDEAVKDAIKSGNEEYFIHRIRGKLTIEREPMVRSPIITEDNKMLCDSCGERYDWQPQPPKNEWMTDEDDPLLSKMHPDWDDEDE